MQTMENNKIGIGIAIIIIVFLIWATVQISGSFGGGRKDSDCIEWGVEVENPNGTKGWAFTHSTPRNKEEAELMARDLEMMDRGGRYYTARCRRYKGDR